MDTMAKIMIIDDEAIMTMQLEEKLTSMGYNVVGTSSYGEEAVDLANRLHPDLILMDIVMEDKMDGIEVAEIIKKDLDIPMIFLTAPGEDQFVKRAKALEPFGYISKPPRMLEIKSTIEIALYKIKTIQQLKDDNEKYKKLVENCIDGIAIVQDLEIKFANPALIKMLGCQSTEEILDQNFTTFISPEHRVEMVNLSENMLKGKEITDRNSFNARRKDGTMFDAEITSSIINHKDGAALQVIFRDISAEIKIRNTLKESEAKLNAMLESIGDHISMVDRDLNILWANESSKQYFGKGIIGKKCYAVYHQRKTPCEPYPCHIIRTFEDGQIHHQETEIINEDDQISTFLCTSNVSLTDQAGRPEAVMEVCVDISDRVTLKQKLIEARNHLEHQVIERTKALERESKNTEEINTALKILLNKREEDKKKMEENVLTNVKGLITPFIKKIKKTRLDEQQKVLLNIIETNILEIISPFYRRLKLKFHDLTPTEINIANLIRDGNTTKQIAKLMNISTNTVDTHRKNIRKKIGIGNKKINLRSHLLRIQ